MQKVLKKKYKLTITYLENERPMSQIRRESESQILSVQLGATPAHSGSVRILPLILKSQAKAQIQALQTIL